MTAPSILMLSPVPDSYHDVICTNPRSDLRPLADMSLLYSTCEPLFCPNAQPCAVHVAAGVELDARPKLLKCPCHRSGQRP
jgi:hypothetical protein